MPATEVCPSVTGIAEGNQVIGETVGFVIVNVMNMQILRGSTFHTGITIPLADGGPEFFCPLKGIRELGYATAPVGVVLPTYLLAMPHGLALAAAKTPNLEVAGHDPHLLTADLASYVLAALAKFGAAFTAACSRFLGSIPGAESLSANLTDAVSCIFLFSDSASPTTQPSPILVLGRCDNEWLATPPTLNLKAGAPSKVRTFAAAIEVLANSLRWQIRNQRTALVAWRFKMFNNRWHDMNLHLVRLYPALVECANVS